MLVVIGIIVLVVWLIVRAVHKKSAPATAGNAADAAAAPAAAKATAVGEAAPAKSAQDDGKAHTWDDED